MSEMSEQSGTAIDFPDVGDRAWEYFTEAAQQGPHMTDNTERKELVKKLRWRLANLPDDCIEAHIFGRCIAALTAQPQQEPSIWVRGYSIGFERPPNQHLHEWTPYYTAPQPGVREGMLRAAEQVPRDIPEMSVTHPDYDSHHDAYRSGWNSCAKITREAITRAAEQINAEGQRRGEEVSLTNKPSHVGDNAAPSAPHAEQTHVSVPVDRGNQTLTDGSAVPADRSHTQDRGDGQQKGYVVLSADERAKGFVRPVRQRYVHKKCGVETHMGLAVAETYARDPEFYGETFCVSCKGHFPLDEFVWSDTDERVGS